MRRVWIAKSLAFCLILGTGYWALPPQLEGRERSRLAERFSFSEERIRPLDATEPTGKPTRSVAPWLEHMRSWILSVGASGALADLSDDGLPNDLCMVDPRVDEVVIHSLKKPPAYEPVVLRPESLLVGEFVAPMGCLTGDFDESGRADVLVYYWGRSPIIFLRNGPVSQQHAFDEQELVDPPEVWNSSAATTADMDGDGHLDLILGAYFPDGSRVFDQRMTQDSYMAMPDSMSRALNGGKNRIQLWAGHRRTPDGRRLVEYREVTNPFPGELAFGWTLALGAADLDGDMLPELYVAEDFGPDRLFHNRSARGSLRLVPVEGRRSLKTPASKIVGRGSFKGMGVDFGDIGPNGLLDIAVSNIATEFGLQESHYTFLHTGENDAFMRGRAPYVDESERLGTARGGWAWDVKFGDFDNSGTAEIVQATGFIRGKRDRWPELQEFAMSNDTIIRRPEVWPRFADGDDVSGHEPNAFFVRSSDGRFYDLAKLVGLGRSQVSRGIAIADLEGDGLLDLFFANQWEDSRLYRNRSKDSGSFLGLDLVLPLDEGTRTAVLDGRISHLVDGRAAVGAQVLVKAQGSVQRALVDGGNGHSGRRDPSVHVGLGRARDAGVEIKYRDQHGVVRLLKLLLRPGWHTIVLGEEGE